MLWYSIFWKRWSATNYYSMMGECFRRSWWYWSKAGKNQKILDQNNNSPIALSADFIKRIQLACNTKLPPACKDKAHPKACLFNTTLDKARLIIDISIKPEKGPHGEERIVTINKHQKHQQALDHTIKVPWIQLPKMLPIRVARNFLILSRNHWSDRMPVISRRGH